jgi:hypothetical protein
VVTAWLLALQEFDGSQPAIIARWRNLTEKKIGLGSFELVMYSSICCVLSLCRFAPFVAFFLHKCSLGSRAHSLIVRFGETINLCWSRCYCTMGLGEKWEAALFICFV